MGPGSFDLYTLGWSLVLQPMPLVLLVAGVFLGIVFGAMPGLTANMGVAILVPFTYALSPTAAILMLIGVYCGAVYGGSISATLINIPGTPAALMTVFDAYPMRPAGRSRSPRPCGQQLPHRRPLSVVALAVFAPVIARTLPLSGPRNILPLRCFWLSVVAYVSGSQT